MKTFLKFTFLFLLTASFTSTFAQSKTTKSTKTAKVGSAAAAQKPVAIKPAVQMTFKDESVELGTIKKGSKKTFDYEFENTGTETIEIEIVSGCDCTTLDWTRGPIKPGGSGKINVIFDSTEKELSETSVDVDIYLKNKDKKTGSQILKIVNYTFKLVK
jgi:hypothetical protein